MHVLPLPFGLALAVLPRREAQVYRSDEKEPIRIHRGPTHRERILTDPKFASYRREIF